MTEADRFAEKLAEEAWNDPVFRERIKALLLAAIENALVELSRPRPPQ
jgi:hypothetical protein